MIKSITELGQETIKRYIPKMEGELHIVDDAGHRINFEGYLKTLEKAFEDMEQAHYNYLYTEEENA